MSKVTKEWYDESHIKSMSTLNEDGLRHGVSRTWHPNGALHTEANFVEGKLVGMTKFWNSSGSLTKTVNHDFEGNIFEIGFSVDDTILGLMEKFKLGTIEDLRVEALFAKLCELEAKNLDLQGEMEKLKQEKDKQPQKQFHLGNKERVTFT